MAAVYNGYPVTRTYRAIAICSARIHPKITVATTTVDPNQHVEDTAACPGGTVAGTTDGDAPRFWEAGFLNRGAKTRVKVLAVCG